MGNKKNTLIFISFLVMVGSAFLGLHWSATGIQEELNRPLNDYDCNTAEECYYFQPVCKRYAIQNKTCVRDGMTGGFFDNNIYYICEGYGKMTNSCQDYYSFEEWDIELDKMRSDAYEVDNSIEEYSSLDECFKCDSTGCIDPPMIKINCDAYEVNDDE